MAHRVLEAMLLGAGIEVATGGLEVRRFAEGLLVDVDGVLTHGEVLEIDLDGELVVLARGEGGGAGVFTVGGLEGNSKSAFGRFCESGNGEEADGEGGNGKTHNGFSPDGPESIRCF
jgi:hypothetical protein